VCIVSCEKLKETEEGKVLLNASVPLSKLDRPMEIGETTTDSEAHILLELLKQDQAYMFTRAGSGELQKAGFFAVPLLPSKPSLCFATEPTQGETGFHSYSENAFPLICKFHPSLIREGEAAKKKVWGNLWNMLQTDPILVLKAPGDPSFQGW
jgi:hypothetical protein